MSVGHGLILIDKSLPLNQAKGKRQPVIYIVKEVDSQLHMEVDVKLEICCYIKQVKSQKGFTVAENKQIAVCKLVFHSFLQI